MAIAISGGAERAMRIRIRPRSLRGAKTNQINPINPINPNQPAQTRPSLINPTKPVQSLMTNLTTGSLIDHKAWGRGKLLAIRYPNGEAYFPSLVGDVGGATRLVRLSVLTTSGVQSDPLLDHVGLATPAVKRRARPVKAMEHDLARAIEWFEGEYPGRFDDPKLVAGELTHKREAHALFVERLGEGRGAQLIADGKGDEIGQILDTLWHHTNIPSRFETMAAHDGLKDGAAAARLLDAVHGLLAAPGAVAFERLSQAVSLLPAPAGGSRVHTWPNVTLLPFLADPARFIVAKPEVTKRIAARMGRDLLYSTAVKWDTYARVLDMSQKLRDALAPLGARDYIDVFAFIWLTRDLS
jgi:hypothetical protein